MAFEIEEGVVHVTADVDRSSLARAAKEAGEQAGVSLGDGIVRGTDGRLRDAKGRFVASGRSVGGGVSDGAEEELTKRKSRFGGLIKSLFTPNPQLFAQLRAPFAAALSTPIGAAAVVVAGVFATTFAAAAITAIAGIGLGTILLGLGGLALFGGREDRQKALDDLEKAEKKVKDAEFAARKGSAASVRNLAKARDQLAEAQKAVQDGKAFAALDKALQNVQETLRKVGLQAAMPLLRPFTKALGDVSKLIKDIGPDFRSIFSDLAPVVPALTQGLSGFVKNVVSGLKDSMPGIVTAFTTFARVLPVVGQWLGDFFRAIFKNTDVIDNVTESVLKFVFGPLKWLGPLISGLTVLFGAFNNIITMATEGWDYARGVLVDFLDGGTGAIGRMKEAWGPLADAIQNVWDKLVAFAGADTDEEIAQTFTDLVQAIKEAWGPLKGFLGTVWDESWVIIKNIWNSKVVPWWEDTAEPWLKERIKDAMQAAWDLAVAIVKQKIKELVDAAVSLLIVLPARVAAAIFALPGRISAVFSTAVATAKSGASSLVNGTVGIITQLPGKITSALATVKTRVVIAFIGAGSWLYSAGQAVVRGFINGIFSMGGSLISAARWAGSLFKANKGPIEKDRIMLVPEGKAIMEGLIAGFRSGVGDLVSTLSGVSGAIPALIGGQSGSLAFSGGPAVPFSPSSSGSSSSGSTGSMAPSFDVKVYIGDQELKGTIRAEISEHDRSLGGQVSSGTGGFRL